MDRKPEKKPADKPENDTASEAAAKGGRVGGGMAGGGKVRGGAAPGGADSALRLINPTVRDYMEALSLRQFYGGYQPLQIDPEVLNLGIGEVAGIDLPVGMYEAFQRFCSDDSLAPLVEKYAGTMGEPLTNHLLAQHWNSLLGQERFGEDCVVSLDGGQNVIEVATRVFTNPLGSPGSDRVRQYVLMGVPCYPYYSTIVAVHAGIQGFLAYDGESFTRGVETCCNKSVGVIIVNVPQNPVGYGLNGGQVERINRVARAYDCAIVVDAVYANYSASEETCRVLAGFDPERTIITDSFSKKFGLPGLRLGFALSASRELNHALRFIKMSESLTPSNLILAFAGYLLEHHGEVPGLLGEGVRRRHLRFRESFDLSSLEGVNVIGEQPEPGRTSMHSNPFYLLLDITALCGRCGMDDRQVARFCQEEFGVRVFPGAWVHPDPRLSHEEFRSLGRLNPHGKTTYLAPDFPRGAQIVFSQEISSGRRSLLRLSFGAEERIEQAAAALAGALRSLWNRAGS